MFGRGGGGGGGVWRGEEVCGEIGVGGGGEVGFVEGCEVFLVVC